MTTIKEYLQKIKCPCGNHNIKRMVLYFVADRPEDRITTTKYVSCLECNTIFKVDDHNYMADFLLEPVTSIGG